MKVVLFCGGLGTRLREHSDTIPKPLVPVGNRPIIWQLMKYYAHYGHKDFILCLGFKGEMLREYFLNYNPNLTRNFSIEPGGTCNPAESDIVDWRITFVDTGLHTNIGQRLLRIRPYLDGEEVFLANYSDQLSNLPLPDQLKFFRANDALASFAAVQPSHSFHAVSFVDGGCVNRIQSVKQANLWINGGYMILRKEIFDYIEEGEELVEEPFGRLIERERLFAYRYDGFWASMDTFKDKIMFDRMQGMRDCPWQVWDE
jgi:glucose-1-phosphate cytidylyltransferase